MEQVWSKIPGYSHYEVSNDGYVRSDFKGVLHTLKPFYSYVGYPMVKMTPDTGKRTNRTIHSLVAQAFCENPKPELYSVVRHLDDNPLNNVYTNLEYGTQQMNMDDKCAKHNQRRRPVRCVETGEEFISCQDAANNIGVSRTTISDVCHGKLKRVHGLHFEYI